MLLPAAAFPRGGASARRAALQDRDADSELVVAGLEILGEHAALRGEEGAEENPDLFHPMYLPRAGMVSLTLHLVATTQGTVQQTAVKCLIDTAGAAGGEQGAARAGQQELESLLAAIQVLIDSKFDSLNINRKY